MHAIQTPPQDAKIRFTLIRTNGFTNHLPNRRANRIAIAIFGLFLLAPLVGAFFRTPATLDHENRPLNPAPPVPRQRWQWQSFPFVFDAYFNDRTAFRRELLTLRRHVVLETLGDSTANFVWIGRDGWLFTNTVGPNNLPYDGVELQQRVDGWVNELARRREWLASRGIRYRVIVAPEKSSVYPEFLPESIRRHPPHDFAALLRERLGDLIIDPLDAILSAKRDTPQLYFQRDTHWTDAGTHVAYRLLENCFKEDLPGFRAKPWDRFQIRPWHTPICDLARALGRPAEQCGEDMLIYDLPNDPYHRIPDDPILTELDRMPNRLKHIEPLVMEAPSGVGRVLFLHDSFGHNLKRMLASDCRRLVCGGTYGFPEAVVAAEKPDLVLQLMVARSVIQVDPNRPEK